jgi:hypothetical protein
MDEHGFLVAVKSLLAHSYISTCCFEHQIIFFTYMDITIDEYGFLLFSQQTLKCEVLCDCFVLK